ncbi:hypothetical protein Bbelb_390880 [Branchiostoma belcheri]|nr:hypothetical protein Bbelb_390880 [Branchiostoma belcheri]
MYAGRPATENPTFITLELSLRRLSRLDKVKRPPRARPIPAACPTKAAEADVNSSPAVIYCVVLTRGYYMAPGHIIDKLFLRYFLPFDRYRGKSDELEEKTILHQKICFEITVSGCMRRHSGGLIAYVGRPESPEEGQWTSRGGDMM